MPDLAQKGGAEYHAAALALALAGRGLDITVFCLHPLPAEIGYRHALPAAGIRLVSTRPPSGRGGDATSAGSTAPIDASLNALLQQPLAEFRRRLRRSAAVAPPDVVHVHGSRLHTTAAAAIAARDGFPTVYTEHTTLGESDSQFRPIPDRAWAYLEAIDVVTCVSSHTRSIVSAMVPADVRVLPARHIVAGPDASPVSRRRQPDELSIVCLSRLSAEKGMDVLVDTAALLLQRAVPVRITLAGYGAQQRELVDRIGALGLASTVGVLGGYEPRDLPALLRSADVVVSTSHTEGLPLAMLEAFSYGVPVVATDVGGVSEIVAHEVNGLLVPPNDPEATASALARLAGDEALRLRLAEQARATFEKGGHSPSEVVNHTLVVYSLARARAAERAPRPTGLISARASRLTSSSLSQVFRAAYSRLAPPTRRWRNAWFG